MWTTGQDGLKAGSPRADTPKSLSSFFAQAHNRHGIGQIIADHMRANRKDYGIWYVIWNRRIASQATPAAAGGPRERHVRPYAAEKRNLAEAIAELPEIVNGHDDVLAEAAGITGGSLYAWPSLTLGMS
jgi:hypothetical protein